MKKISFALVALTAAFINLNTASAQLPDAGTSSSSTDPDLLTCRGEFSRSELCPQAPSTTPPRVRRPPQPQWHVVVNGDLEDSRQHGEIDTDFGRTEYGIGGHAECPEGTIPLVIAPAGLRHLQDAADHRFATGTFCAPLGSTGPINIDLSQYVTITMFEDLVRRVAALEEGLRQNNDVDIAQNDELGDALETIYRRDCADKMGTVSFQQWEAATPAQRIELCPQVVVINNGDRDRMHYRLRLGGQLMIGSSVDSTLLTAGLATLGVEFFSANNRHGLILRGEIGSSNMRGTEGHAPIRRATLFGGSVAYGFRPLNWATISLGGRVLGVSDHNGNPDVYHGYRGTLAGPELALTLDRQIQNGPFGVYFRVSASFLRGQVNYWINSEEIQAGRSSVNLGLEGGFTFGR